MQVHAPGNKIGQGVGMDVLGNRMGHGISPVGLWTKKIVFLGRTNQTMRRKKLIGIDADQLLF
jgi:hypothetical protein